MINMVPQIKGLAEALIDIKSALKAEFYDISGLANINFNSQTITIETNQYAEVEMETPYFKHIKILVLDDSDTEDEHFVETNTAISVWYNENSIRIFNETESSITVKLIYKEGTVANSQILKDKYSMIPGDSNVDLLTTENIINNETSSVITYVTTSNGYINVNVDTDTNEGTVTINNANNGMKIEKYIISKDSFVMPVAKNQTITITYDNTLSMDKCIFIAVR